MHVQSIHSSTLPGAQRSIVSSMQQSLVADRSQSSAETFQQLLPGDSTTVPVGTPIGPLDATSRLNQLSDTELPVASDQLREAFRDFVGQTFFSELIKSYRSTQQPAAYFNGGQAEKIFQGQLDQVLSEALSKSSAEKIADPMFELFMMDRAG